MYLFNFFYSSPMETSGDVSTSENMTIRESVEIRRRIGVEMLRDAIKKLKPMKRVHKAEYDDSKLQLREAIKRLRPMTPVPSLR